MTVELSGRAPQPDELTSIVIETGSSWTRAGFSGEGLPKYVVPTAYGRIGEDGAAGGEYLFDDEGVNSLAKGKNIYNPMADGCVQDWDAVSKLWRYVYESKLQLDPTEFPLLTTEQPWNPMSNKVQSLEVAFEDLQVPVFSLVKNPLCAAYESARATALVIDVGSAVASVTPVVDGSIISKAAFHTKFAGDFVNLHIISHLHQRMPRIKPYYEVKRKSITDPGQQANPQLKNFGFQVSESFETYHIQRVLTEFKESTSQICEVPFSLNSHFARIGRPFEFPSGFNLTFGPERLTTAEPLFRPLQYMLPGVSLPEGSQGLGDMLGNSLASFTSNLDTFGALLSHIILIGGTSLIPGFTERVHYELMSRFPNYTPRFFLPESNVERKSTVWMGASILASLGTFDQNSWVTKQEYEEYGAELAEKRFK